MRHEPSRRILQLVLIAAAASVAGCGPRTYTVQGQLVFEDDSPAKELAGYTIMFQSIEHQKGADGIIQADGTFTVGTNRDGDGAMLGKQRVAITPPTPEVDAPRPRSLILKKYGSFDTSELEVEIKAETNRVKIKVERAK